MEREDMNTFKVDQVETAKEPLSTVTMNKILEENENVAFGTYMEGNSVYSVDLPENGLLILGNEGKGISEEVGLKINAKNRLSIPQYGRKTTESLNVATATAIFLSEIRRGKT